MQAGSKKHLKWQKHWHITLWNCGPLTTFSRRISFSIYPWPYQPLPNYFQLQYIFSSTIWVHGLEEMASSIWVEDIKCPGGQLRVKEIIQKLITNLPNLGGVKVANQARRVRPCELHRLGRTWPTHDGTRFGIHPLTIIIYIKTFARLQGYFLIIYYYGIKINFAVLSKRLPYWVSNKVPLPHHFWNCGLMDIV